MHGIVTIICTEYVAAPAEDECPIPSPPDRRLGQEQSKEPYNKMVSNTCSIHVNRLHK